MSRFLITWSTIKNYQLVVTIKNYQLVVDASDQEVAKEFYDNYAGHFNDGKDGEWDLDDILELDGDSPTTDIIVNQQGEIVADLREDVEEKDLPTIGTICGGGLSTREALELCLRMAKRLYQVHGEVCGARNLKTVDEALYMLEDLIVNEFGDE